MAIGLAACGICRNQVSQVWLAVVLAALRQRIEAPALFGGQPMAQPVMHVPPGLMTHFNAEAFECGGPGKDDPTEPTLLQDQSG
jgi:hypothetical protein